MEPTSCERASRNSVIPSGGQYPFLLSFKNFVVASRIFLGVFRLISPKWNGNTLWPFLAQDFASAETANAVSVPNLFNLLFSLPFH